MLAVAAPVAFTPAAAQSGPAAQPNAVITWNIHAQTAIIEARQPPTATTRSFAMVQGAVYDAVNAIAGTPYQPYLVAPPARHGDSTPAAVATAAYRVLLSLFSDQAPSLGVRYDEALAAIPDGDSKRGGIAVGEAAAEAMIASRRDDGASDTDEQWPVDNHAPAALRAISSRPSTGACWRPAASPGVHDPWRWRMTAATSAAANVVRRR